MDNAQSDSFATRQEIVKKLLGDLWLRLTGWHATNAAPELDKYVLIAAPHTSNWDFPYTIAFGWHLGVYIQWMGKDALFRPPFGWLARAVGGIPIDRSKSNNIVDAMVDELKSATNLCLVVPASGTRSYRDYWKSGFYYIAKKADVPIVPVALDYGTKTLTFAEPIVDLSDLGTVMDTIRQFYTGVKGKFPREAEPHSPP